MPIAPHGKQIVRNLLMLADGTVLAGYRIGSNRWDYTGRDAKIALMNADADVYSALTGRTYHERVCTRPHPIEAWARNLDRRTNRKELPDVHVCEMGAFTEDDLLKGRCGCETWISHLRRMQDRIYSSGVEDKVVYRYFSVGKARGDLRRRVLDYIRTGKPHNAIAGVIADEKRVNDIVRGGWPGTERMNEQEQATLRIRSLMPGILPEAISNPDEGWDEVSPLESNIRWTETPFGRTVTVNAWINGRQRTSAARVLTVSRLADLHYPDNGLPPWQTLSESVQDSDRRTFSVEWSVVGRLLDGEALSAQAEHELRQARFVQRDYQKFDETPPSTVENAIRVASDSRDQITTGQGMESARFVGQIQVIVSGATAEIVEERCAALTRKYSGNALRMDFTGPDCQSAYLRSTVPGEKWDQVGYQRRLRLPYLSAGMPTTTGTVGDGKGPYLGHTRSGGPVMHDPHYATELLKTGRAQNMHLVIGTLGSGKSVLAGSIAHNSTRRGIRTIISDPSGPLARLAEMPELAPYSQVIDLAQSRRGVLSPPSLIREPIRDEYDEPGQWADAKVQAEAERRDLLLDMALRCCAADLYEDPATRHILREAARAHTEAGGRWSMASTMWDLVHQLPSGAVKGALLDASTAPLLSLMFAADDGVPGRVDGFSHYDKTLTVITMPGVVRAPDDVPRRDWNPREVGADAVLRLVALFTDRLIYTKKRHDRGVVIFDEAEMLTDSGPGRSAISRLGRDHSKHNLAVYLCVKSINPQMLSGELKNFLASIFVGRMAGNEPAALALDLLGLDAKYVNVLTGLSTHNAGEFIHKDVDGRVGGLKVDVDYYPALKAALLTDPTPDGSADWINEEEMA